MPRFVIERHIEGIGKADAQTLREAAARSNGVLKQLNREGAQVQWIESFVSDDTLHCVYIAENEALVREHAKRGGFPADRIFEVRGVMSPVTAE